MKNKTDIINWIDKIEKIGLEKFECACQSEFGFITLPDGRKAQIQVILEADEDDFFD